MEKKPLLSIALLCSNRIDTVRRCLDSLVPILERIPSELILLDTSTDPRVPPVLAEYTDNITKYKWTNNFSAARNETVKRAKGEWYLYIDDDEWFVELDELFAFFETGEYKKYGCANYIQRNFHDPDLQHYSDSWASRMIRMTPETHFESKIHEYLEPVPGECKNLHVVANHTGYITVTEEDKRKRYDRNSVLLKEMIEEQPEVLRWRVQLAQEYNSMHMWEELLALSLENLEFTKDRDERIDNRDIGTFYAGAVEAYIQLKDYQKALEIGQKALCDKRIHELCHAYIYLRFAVVGFYTENWSLARKSVESYFLVRQELEKNRTRLEFQEGALLVDEAFDSVPTKRAWSVFIAADLKEGKTDALHQFLPQMEWDQKVIYVFEPLIPVLLEAMGELSYEPILAETMQLMWNNSELQKQILRYIGKLGNKEVEVQNRFNYVLAQLSCNHWYIWYNKVMVGEEQLYLSIDFDAWKKYLHAYIEKAGKAELLALERHILASKTREDVRYDYFFARVAEAKVLYNVASQNYEQRKGDLENFAKLTLAFLRKYFQPEIFETYMELLPAYGQVAVLIENAFALEQENPAEMLRVLKEVVDYYPAFSDVIRSFLSVYGQEQKDKKRREKEEMESLKVQILAEVQKCIKSKQYEQALSIVQQLKQMHPDDLELTSLALEIRLASLG